MLVGRRVLGVEIGRRHVVAALLLAIALGLSLALALLPGAGLRWGLIKTLRGLGMAEVSMSDADLSLFRGRVVIRRMVARPPQGTALGVDDFALQFRWSPLLERKLVVDRMALQGVRVDIRRDARTGGFVINGLPLAIAGAASPDMPAEAVPWGVSVATLDISDSRLILADGDTILEVEVRRLLVENLHSRDAATPMSFRLDGSLNGAALSLAGSLQPFAAEPSFNLSLDLKGFDLTRSEGAAIRAGLAGLTGRADLSLSVGGVIGPQGPAARASGKMSLSKFALAAPVVVSAARIGLDLGHADWDGKRLDLAATLDAETLDAKTEGLGVAASSLRVAAPRLTWDGTLAWQGSLDAAGAMVTAGGLEASPGKVTWNGRLDLAPAAAEPTGRAEGRLELGGLRLVLPDMSYSHRHAQAEGWLAFGPKTRLPVTAKLTLSGEDIALHDTARNQDWLAVEHLDILHAAIAASGAVTADRMNATGLAVLKRAGKGGFPWRGEVRSLQLDQPSRNANGAISASDLRLDGLTLRVTRTRNGWLGLPQSDDTGKQQGPAKAPDGPAIRLDRLSIAGASRILFDDRSLSERVRLEIRDVALTTGALDSQHSDQDSGFDLKAGIGEASVALVGTVRPFAESLTARIDGRIQALELPPLSPYLAEALGIHLHTGQFNGSFKGGADKGALDGRLDLTLSQLFIAPPDPNAPVARKMDMPVETVLDLLRDGDGRITLALPVRGDLAKPDLDVSDAVAQAVAGALKSTMLTTLKIAFPVVTLISMVVDADDKARLALAPLTFPAGGDALSADSRKTLAGVADLMKNRPGLNLTLCGKADLGDWPALAERRRTPARSAEVNRDALARLAEGRAATAKAYLVDDGGIEAGRLFTCRAEVEAATPESKGPRVDLLL